ncbi:MAG: transposase [Chloroflexi bacterium]|nr:transposase [Chloroflexota bacterium]
MDYVYLWADGVHFNVRLEHDRLCCLVLVGVRADGRKDLVAIGDGYRESTEPWSELLRDLKRRGMRAPVLAIGDGALGFWGARRDVFPESREPGFSVEVRPSTGASRRSLRRRNCFRQSFRTRRALGHGGRGHVAHRDRVAHSVYH